MTDKTKINALEVSDAQALGIVLGSMITSAAKPVLKTGFVLALVISWSVNKSVLWALIHGFCSWMYVLYYLLF